MKSWLKGGSIGVSVGIALFVLNIIFPIILLNNNMVDLFVVFNQFFDNIVISIILFVLLCSTFLFLLGSLIGIIVEIVSKILNRK
jgi:hypothetical protein